MSTKTSQTRPAVNLPLDVAAQLKEFSDKTGIPGARIAAAALSKYLPKLISGEAAIVNGKYVELPEKPA